MPKKIRVYELARELGLTNKEALDICIDLGIGVKSHSSSIEDAQADRARRKADREGLRRAVQPEEPAPAPAAAAKSGSSAPSQRADSPTAADRPVPLLPSPRPTPHRPDRNGDGTASRPRRKASPVTTNRAQVSASS